MPKTDPSRRAEADIHLEQCLEDYAAGRLNSPREEQIEAHLLTCDACFAAYVALLVRRE